MSKNNMYMIPPLYTSSPITDLPICMYKMNCLYESNDVSGPGAGFLTEMNDQDSSRLPELEKSQLALLKKLECLKDKVIKLKESGDLSKTGSISRSVTDSFQAQDIVIKANPQNPPLSIWVFYSLLSKSFGTKLWTYKHSSLKSMSDNLKHLPCLDSKNGSSNNLDLTVVWQADRTEHEMMIDPINQGIIEGEVNIARYLSRLLFTYDDTDPITTTLIDNFLDIAQSLLHGNNKDRNSSLKTLNTHLGKHKYLVGDALTVADVVTWSALAQAKSQFTMPANVAKWFGNLMEEDVFRHCAGYVKL